MNHTTIHITNTSLPPRRPRVWTYTLYKKCGWKGMHSKSYHILRHNGGKGNHEFCGVTIILSPQYYAGWKDAGARTPMTTDAEGEFASHYISINVTLKSYNRMEKQVRGKKGD